jgi:hypothetical protein
MFLLTDGTGTIQKKRGCGLEIILSELSEAIPDKKSPVESVIETSELTQIINDWLYGLTRDDRSIFLRRYWYGDNLKILAAEFNTSANKMAGRLFRLRKNLKSVLEERGISI